MVQLVICGVFDMLDSYTEKVEKDSCESANIDTVQVKKDTPQNALSTLDLCLQVEIATLFMKIRLDKTKIY